MILSQHGEAALASLHVQPPETGYTYGGVESQETTENTVATRAFEEFTEPNSYGS